MFPQFLGDRRNTAFSMEHPPLSSSSARCEDDAGMGTSLYGCSDERTQIDLFYSASGPDMFALVTSILQEPNDPEDMTEWDSQSNSFLPPCILDLENSSRYSSLFPMDIWGHGNQANLIESRSSYEEKLKKASPIEPLSRKFCDLQVTGASALPCPPCFPPSHDVLGVSHPQNKGFAYQGLNRLSNIVPEFSNSTKQVDFSRRDCFSSPICPPEYYREDLAGIARSVLGASNTEKSIEMLYSPTDGLWYPVILERQLCATSYTNESPQFNYLPTSPFQQVNSIPEGANTELSQNQQQFCPSDPSAFFNYVKSENSAYPLRDSSNPFSPLPGFQQQNSPYSGDQCLRSRSLNPSGACLTYKNPNEMNVLPWESSVNSSVAQPFGFQMASQQGAYLQNDGFSNCKGNLKPHNSVRCPRLDLRASRPKRSGEIPRNIPPRHWPSCLSASDFPKPCRLDRAAPNEDHAGWQTGKSERRAKTNPAFVGPDWTQLDILKGKNKPGHLFDFLNPAFLHLFPLDNGCGQVPNFPSFRPPPFSPSCPSFPVDRQEGNIPHAINRDASVSHYVLPPLIPQDTVVPNHVGPCRVLYLCIEDCYGQWRALERERTKMEADLAVSFPTKSFTTSDRMPFFRLRADCSRVDRLIWIQFQEQAKVCILLQKLRELFGVPIYKNTWIILGRHLEAIRTTQVRRNVEIFNAGTHWKPHVPRVVNEKDILALASAVNKLRFFTQKTRTVLWSVFQHIVFPRNFISIPA